MQSYSRIFSHAVFCLLLLLAGSLQAAEGLIEEVSFQKMEGNRESVIFKLNGPHLPSDFALNGERPRVVFDFVGTSLARTVPQTIVVDGRMARHVRMGRYETKTRAVIDLVPDRKVAYEQSFDEENNILSIHLFPQGALEQQEVKKKTEVVSEKAPAAAAPAVKKQNGSSTTEQRKVLEKDAAVAAGGQGTVEAEGGLEEEAGTAAGGNMEEVSRLDSGESSAVSEKTAREVSETAAGAVESAAGDTGPAPDPLLHSVRFKSTENKGEMVLFKLNGFYPPTVSGKEEGGPQVICDFAGTRIAENVSGTQEINGQFVQRLQVQQLAETDLVRVVIDLVPSRNYDLQQVFFKEDNLFVVIVNSYDELSEPDQPQN